MSLCKEKRVEYFVKAYSWINITESVRGSLSLTTKGSSAIVGVICITTHQGVV
jgi:hypothetical protein